MLSTLQVYTDLHTAISLVGLLYGVPAVTMLFRKFRGGMAYTTAFIALAFTSTLTGFFFPFHGFTPAIGVGIVTMVIFGAMYLSQRGKLQGKWRPIFALTIVAQEFFLMFVAIAQSFQKIPYFHHFAPTGAEPAFAIAQGINFAIFAVIGIAAAIKFKPYSRTGK